jgi:hypothetical protein
MLSIPPTTRVYAYQPVRASGEAWMIWQDECSFPVIACVNLLQAAGDW